MYFELCKIFFSLLTQKYFMLNPKLGFLNWAILNPVTDNICTTNFVILLYGFTYPYLTASTLGIVLKHSFASKTLFKL